MRNIVKAQFFQIVRDKVIRGMLVVALLMQVLVVLLPIWLDNEEITSAGEFFATNEGGIMMFPIFYVIVVTAQICGSDFGDKTHNYELMSGHRRWDVFGGRVIPALLFGGIGGLFLIMLPVGIYAVLYGWGSKVSFGWVFLRLILMLFPLLRMVCEFAFWTFLIKNPYGVMGFCLLVFELSMGVTEVLECHNVFLSMSNIPLLMMVSKWVTFGLGNDIHCIYDASLSGDVVWGTIIASVVFGTAALYLGYVFFKNDDMN